MNKNKEESKAKKIKRGVGVYKNQEVDSKSDIFREKINLEEFENETLKVDKSTSTLYEETSTQEMKVIDLSYKNKKKSFFNKNVFSYLSIIVVTILIIVTFVMVI